MAINFTKNIEDISRQIADINKDYLHQTVSIIEQLKSGSVQNKITNINQDVIADVFNGIVKLNLEYYGKLMNFGLSVTKQVLGAEDQQTDSAFTLSGSGLAGSSIQMSFVLDNTKNEKALCELQCSLFSNIDNQTETEEIQAFFKPQSFELNSGESAQVTVICEVARNIPSGTYYATVRVQGFEPAYFTIVLTIDSDQTNSENNEPGKKTKQRK